MTLQQINRSLQFVSRIGFTVFAGFSFVLSMNGCSDEGPERCADSPLLEDVRRDGSVRVVVTLAGSYAPEAELTEQEIQAQRALIREIQDRILSDLSGTQSQLVRRYDVLPLMTVTLDEEGLCILLNSVLVDSVQRDVIDRTF